MVGYRRFTLTILLTLALSLGNFAFALPTTGSSTLEGRVFQSDLKTPAPDLGVQVIPSGSEKVAATGSTDSRGHFEIANVPAGEILLVLVDGTGRAVGASRIDTRAAPSRALTLALPDPEARLAPAKTEDDGEASKSGFWRWVSTPAGATVALLVVGAGTAALVDSALDDEKTVKDLDPPVSESEPR